MSAPDEKTTPKPKRPRRKKSGAAFTNEMVRQALQEVGGIDYLKRMAEKHPAHFAKLVHRMMSAPKAEKPNDGKITVILSPV